MASVQLTSPPSLESASPSWLFDFRSTTPDVALFPRRLWIRAVERTLRTVPAATLDYGDHRGRIELRLALARYLTRARGVRVDPAHIVVTQGFTQALDLLCRVLAGSGHRALAMETPSHPGFWPTVRQAGLELFGCPVDADGLRIDHLGALNVGAVVVAPAHQYPTGAVLSAERRVEIVRWAAGGERLVIEDDYDAEFRYDRAPIGSVQGLEPSRVAHVGGASKTLAPGLRLGWTSCPPELVRPLQEQKAAADSGSPTVDQLALADLIERGEYERHVIRARHVYRRRRDALVSALRNRLPRFTIHGTAAGMQLLLGIPDTADDVAIAAEAAARRIHVSPLSTHHLIASPRRGLLLGYGRLSEARIGAAVEALAELLPELPTSV